MSEYIAVSGLTIGHSSGSPVSGGTFTLTSIPSLKVKADGKGVYSGTLAFTFIGGTHTAGASGTATGGGTITVSATKTKADGSFVFLVGDTGTLAGAYVTSVPTTISFESDVEITNAGQTKVKGT